MRLSRRSFLLSGVSTLALLGVPALRGAAAPSAVPAALYEPGVDAMAAAVQSIASLIAQQPGLIGIDLCDLRAVLEGGGRAGYGQGVRGSS